MQIRVLLKKPFLQLAASIEVRRYHSLLASQLTTYDANLRIKSLLAHSSPHLIGRIGNTEGRIVGEYLYRRKRFSRRSQKQAHQNAGIFPVTSEALEKFAEIYIRSIQSVDLLGFWHAAFQARLLKDLCPQVLTTPLAALEPYRHHSPWSEVLKGRRVLVVHPFHSTISSQYALNRRALFENPAVLPEFQLLQVAPPQTLAPMTEGFNSWKEALDKLTDQVLDIEFDIALLGCGAYGLPLGAAIKSAGRSAVHLGGALQVLFGIKGRRWECIPEISAMMNSSWVRPSPLETPASASLVDQGSYW